MKKKGFTLIELLAVIVILAIIALIAIPLIGNVIEKAKIGALENSVNGLVESASMYYANQSIKGEQAVETIFDFANGEQTSTEKLEYKGKIYNGKLILHANGEVAVCIDDKEHYAYKNKDTDEIVSGIGTCLYDGTTGDFSSNSSIKDLRGQTVAANNVTQSDDGLSTLITIPEEGHYDETSKISILNSDLDNIEIYSNTEKIVGEWIDGKPIYRKTYSNIGTITNTITVIDSTFTNIVDTFINAIGSIETSSGAKAMLLTPSPDGNQYNSVIEVNPGRGLIIYCGTGFIGKIVQHVTIWYTKN